MNNVSDEAKALVGILYMITLLMTSYPIVQSTFQDPTFVYVFILIIIIFGGLIGAIIIAEITGGIEGPSRLVGLASGFLVVLAIELLEFFLILSSKLILVNIALFLLIPAIGMCVAPMTRRRESIKNFDPKILGVAKDYGGVVTKSVIVYELKTSLEVAGKCLERFVKQGEAQKVGTGTLTLYDFPSARTHLSRIDDELIEVLRDNFKGMSRSDLLKATGLTIEPLDEALKRLETKGIIVYDKITNEYKLKGVVIGSHFT